MTKYGVGEKRYCKNCGKPFIKRKWNQRYCSYECNPKEASKFKITRKICAKCEKIFIANPSHVLICGVCQRKRHEKWNERFLNSIEYRWMREDLLQKFDYKCQRCGRRIINVSKFHIHHIVPLSAGGKDVKENITILCIPCHRKIHKELGRIHLKEICKEKIPSI